MQGEWLKAAQTYPEDMHTWVESVVEDVRSRELIHTIFGNSPYLSDLIFSYPTVLRCFLRLGPEHCLSGILRQLSKTASASPTVAMIELRRSKAQAALVIALADITNVWDLEHVTGALSDFADVCVMHAVRTLLLQAHSQGVINLANTERPEESSGYVVLGLGKLGARELNYSSDIDLFVFFDEQYLPYSGKKTPQEFFVRLTKDLVRLLHERTALGYVYRTDLRLRPDPGSTAVAVSREAAQIYYESYGQNWERAALIKARPIAGDRHVAASFLKDLQPFIWRKSLDFYAIQDIQSLKRQMYALKGGGKVDVAGHNIKLGRGGIREIEFFAQIQQLIWGGRFPEARIPQTLSALAILTKLQFVTENARADLTKSYHYLRKLEHRLQMISDEQTQTLPADLIKLSGIAAFMGHESVDSFVDEVAAVLRTVEIHYAGLFEEAPTLAVDGNLVFTGAEDDPDTITTLQRLGFQDSSMVIQTVRTWHHGRYRATRSDRARQLLTEVMPGLLGALGKTTQPDAALLRFDRYLAALPAGVPILSVFYSNPKLLDLVGEIMGDAPRLAEHLGRRSALLDYVLEPEFYKSIGKVEALSEDLNTALAAADSFEFMLDACRRWANDQQFRVGVQCLRHMIDPVIAAEYLTSIAEAVIANLVPRVSAEFSSRFGRISGGSYAFIGYGKLGSFELTPTSDLDLVAIYEADPDAHSEGGPKSLPTSAYYIRLTQRMVTAFTSLTREGRLYALDMRLRPNGAKGPLASSLEAFQKYQTEDAWTWEHMALSRARVVFGPADLRSKIEGIVAEVLSRPRDLEKLVTDVADMRSRMRKEHKDKGMWDIKKRDGGLIDGEFILQYLLLKFPTTIKGDAHPNSLATRLVAAGALEENDGSILREGINFWSRLQFMLRLTTDVDIADQDISQGLKERLVRVAGVKDFPALENLIVETADSISALFRRFFEKPAATIENSKTSNP